MGCRFSKTPATLITGNMSSSPRKLISTPSMITSLRRASFSFALFMGTFNAVQCSLETATGSKHWTCDFFAGFSAMTLLGLHAKAPLYYVLPGACVTGVLTTSLICILEKTQR